MGVLWYFSSAASCRLYFWADFFPLNSYLSHLLGCDINQIFTASQFWFNPSLIPYYIVCHLLFLFLVFIWVETSVLLKWGQDILSVSVCIWITYFLSRIITGDLLLCKQIFSFMFSYIYEEWMDPTTVLPNFLHLQWQNCISNSRC